ncbi:Transposase DDE domain-containing protein [Fontibacillus panacisegetis]|uniref:Transposase DDE domain-containing protein n=1 Tax=Fontibacillus panacisegetis TaxID=670482 RepID=A0A1G7FTK6_9BACL|nr:Transposase DDE domain-containing protein [Fontibacillus panacisegetis]
MDNNTNLSVICQCLQMLNISPSRDGDLDYRARKLFVGSSLLLFIEAQLQQRESYAEMSEHLGANEDFQAMLGGLESISPSQLSRKMKKLPIENLHLVFMQVTRQIQQLAASKPGITTKIGKLKILDSTQITLPAILSKWAYCSASNHGVKMHTSLLVVDAKTMYPDQIIASTKDVADHEVVQNFTVDKEVTYVMDRGYQVHKHFQTWVKQGIKFVARVKDNTRLTIIKERNLPKRGGFIRDADVTLPGQQIKLRLIEFQDQQGRLYRLVTSRLDLSAH